MKTFLALATATVLGFSAIAVQAEPGAPALSEKGRKEVPLPPDGSGSVGSRADLLDALLARLRVAGDDPSAMVIAKSIRELWARSGSDSADLLIGQADRALGAEQADVALRILDLVTARWPDFVEGWRRRAVARYLEGDVEGALEDLDRALALEPRHFAALFAKAAILHEMERLKEALEVYEEALIFYPGMTPAREAVRELRLKLDQEV